MALGSISSQPQEDLLGICVFLASLCSLSNLDSARSVNPSLKPRERLVKLHFSYNQFETSFSLLSAWALSPNFFQSAHIHSPYNHPQFLHLISFCALLSCMSFPILALSLMTKEICRLFKQPSFLHEPQHGVLLYSGLLPSWGKILYASWEKRKKGCIWNSFCGDKTGNK